MEQKNDNFSMQDIMRVVLSGLTASEEVRQLLQQLRG